MKKSDMNRLIGNAALIVLILLTGYTLQAQSANSIYSTMYGKMIISGQVGDSTLMMQTNRLIISLNYESAELVIRADPNTLAGKNKIPESNYNYHSNILFKGKLGLDYVITEKHPPLDFEVGGYLKNGDKENRVTGSGRLEHIHGQPYACILNIDFEVPSSWVGIPWPGDKNIKIQIMQTILERKY